MYGIDVSKYQSADIASVVLKKQNIGFVIVQTSYGLGQANPLATLQIGNAKANHLLLGAYHWLTLDNPIAQAQNAFNQMKAQGIHLTAVPMVDYEQSGVTPSLLDNYIKEYKRLSGVTPVVYTSHSMTYSISSILQSDNAALWVAQYNGSEVQEDGSVIRQFADSWAGMSLDADVTNLTSDQWAKLANPSITTSTAMIMNVVATTATNTVANSTMEDDELMKFTYEVIDTKTNKSQGTVYFYDGNKVVALNHIDQWSIIKTIYKDTTGKDLKHYKWRTDAPWYVRFLQAINQKAPETAWK